MKFSIVVSRYNEDIEWTRKFSNVIIYNKGEEILLNDTVRLDNVGREGHTFYTYIYNHYDELEDFTVFLQGNPFDHSQNIIEKLHTIMSNKDFNVGFQFLSDNIYSCNLSNCIYHSGLPLTDMFEKLFNEQDKNIEFNFGCGGQFIASKASILNRPKDFYLGIVKILETSIDPVEGYVMERFHGLIFDYEHNAVVRGKNTFVNQTI